MATAKKAAKKKAAPKKKPAPMPTRSSYYSPREKMLLTEAIAAVERHFAPVVAMDNQFSALQAKLAEQFKAKKEEFSINIDIAIQSCHGIFSTLPDDDRNKTDLLSKLVNQFNNAKVVWTGGGGPVGRSRRAAKKGSKFLRSK